LKSVKQVVLVVLNNFSNDSRVLKEATSLRRHGFDVTVLALHEKALAESETIDGIQVHRVRLKSRSWSKNRFVQLLKYLEWLMVAAWRCRRVDIVHCNDLNTLPLGVLLKVASRGRVKIVYDAHEYETELNGVAGMEKRLAAWLERCLIKYADKVFTVSDSIANEYRRLYGIPKPELVLNCPPYQEVQKQDLFRKELGIRKEQTIFLYQGGLSRGRGIELLLEAFARLSGDRNVIVFMGYGPLATEVQRHASSHSTIFFREAVSPGILLNYTASADYGVLFYENNCLNHDFCSPNKMFEYLMAGIPVLAANLFEMKRLIEKYGLGVVAKENTVDGFIEAVDASLAFDYLQIQQNVFAIRKLFNWEAQEDVLLRAYDEL